MAAGAIAMDVNEQPLIRAKRHIHEHGLDALISTRLSDGMEKLRPGEADTLLMSGMGGALIVKILRNGMDVAKSAKEIVLSPQSEIFSVRQFLHENGFKIESEDMAFDRGKYYVVMRAATGIQKYGSRAGYAYGQYLIDQKNLVLKKYLLSEKERIENILKSLYGRELSKEADEKRILLEDEYKMAVDALKRMET